MLKLLVHFFLIPSEVVPMCGPLYVSYLLQGRPVFLILRSLVLYEANPCATLIVLLKSLVALEMMTLKELPSL